MTDHQLSLFSPEQDIRVIEFRDSVTPDLYVPGEVVDWENIETRLEELSSAISRLYGLLRSGTYDSLESVAECIRDAPSVLDIMRLVMSIPTTGLAFADGRGFPRKPPSRTRDFYELAALLEEIGVWKAITPEAHLESLITAALIAKDASRRRFRISRNTEQRVLRILTESCKEASSQLGISLSLLANAREFPDAIKRKADYVVSTADGPLATISTVIQTRTGGRQQRDLRLTYPTLQQELEIASLKLILIADGQGFRDTPDSVLRDLFLSVHAVMSIKQAEQGLFVDALTTAYKDRGKGFAPVSRIIESILMAGEPVVPKALPVSSDTARLALGAFIDDHPDLALSLEAGGEKLAWSRPGVVDTALNLRTEFQEEAALELFAELLKARTIDGFDERQPFGRCSVVATDALPFLPEKILVVSNAHECDEEVIRRVAQETLRNDAKLGVLISSTRAGESAFSRIQRMQAALARNIILVSSQTLLRWTMAKQQPYEMFSATVLEQSDLAKISPFVLQGRAPDRMYFGRATEEATALHALASNSVAIVGSRRTGKTSLMHRLAKQLNSMEYLALLADCQTVRDWADFGSVVQQEWNMDLPNEFRPKHLFEMVSQLRAQSLNKGVVILLDEIDQLLQWDMSHPESKVPEAFFKACRTISQAGDAQFVFSGERTIATKLWDPHSPHWNFCRQLPLQQLDRESTERLVMQPLQSLGITIQEPEVFGNLVWEYTSGHPQIAQLLGDKLVQNVNARGPKERYYLNPKDVDAVADTFEFKEHFIQTYWGQAEQAERLITLLAIAGMNTPAAMIEEFRRHSIANSEARVAESLRMLELYGIFRQKGNELQLRAEWFAQAVRSYGDLNRMIEQHWVSLS